jgi:hypothetical protein
VDGARVSLLLRAGLAGNGAAAASERLFERASGGCSEPKRAAAQTHPETPRLTRHAHMLQTCLTAAAAAAVTHTAISRRRAHFF